jgi:hypothetical protein
VGPSEVTNRRAADGKYVCIGDMGLSAKDMQDITREWQKTVAAVQESLLSKNKWAWQLFNCGIRPGTAYGGGCGAASSMAPDQAQHDPGSTCTPWMRKYCGPHSPFHKQALMMGFTFASQMHVYTENLSLPFPEQNIAEFLLVRGKYAWLGYGYQGCASTQRRFPGASWRESGYVWPELLDRDFGEPTGECHETSPGSEVFTRDWSRSRITLDCRDYTATFEMKS